jgi:hypothetical protein
MIEFIIQIDNILKNLPLNRHNTAADKELPEDLPQDGTCLGPPRGQRAAPLAPLQQPLHRPAAQPLPLQTPDWRQGGQHLHLPPQALHRRRLHPHGGAMPARQDLPAAAGLPKRVSFNLTPTPLPVAADPGTVFPGKPTRFFARPGEVSSSRYPQCNRGPPAWQRDFTFFATSRSKEAGGSSVGTPHRGCLPGKPARFFCTPRGSIFKPLPATQPHAAHLATELHLLCC